VQARQIYCYAKAAQMSWYPRGANRAKGWAPLPEQIPMATGFVHRALRLVRF
jgi:hypothetical protein